MLRYSLFFVIGWLRHLSFIFHILECEWERIANTTRREGRGEPTVIRNSQFVIRMNANQKRVD